VTSSTDNTIKEWREATSAKARHGVGLIRRMAIRLTAGVFWRAAGHLLPDGQTRETQDAEVFGGIGFYARPKQGANAEAIVLFVGDDAQNPIIVATRDEAVRKAVADLQQDSTAVFNTTTIILIKPDGTVEIRASGGAATKLPTLADYEALRVFVNNQFSSTGGHTHAVAGAATTTTTSVAAPGAPPAVSVAAPTGTQVLKAQ
jgi:phage gp45-like